MITTLRCGGGQETVGNRALLCLCEYNFAVNMALDALHADVYDDLSFVYKSGFRVAQQNDISNSFARKRGSHFESRKCDYKLLSPNARSSRGAFAYGRFAISPPPPLMQLLLLSPIVCARQFLGCKLSTRFGGYARANIRLASVARKFERVLQRRNAGAQLLCEQSSGKKVCLRARARACA